MAVATLTPARALRKPRRADPRALIGVFLTLAALAGSIAFWVGASDTRPVLIATRDVPAGATLLRSDLAVAYVRLEDGVYHAALPADSLDALVGSQLGEPIHAQQVLARAQLTTKLGLPADQVAITFPARPESAVDGQLRPGDTVQVLATVVDKARNEAHTRVVLERAAVFEVGRDQSPSASSLNPSGTDGLVHGSITSITLALTAEQARQLAEARRTGELDVLLLPPPDAPHP